MLCVRRAELVAYLENLKQSFRTDASNRDSRFTRNRIRNDLLPLLARDYNRSIVNALLRLGSLVGEAQSVIENVVQSAAEQCVQRAATEFCIDAVKLAAHPPHVVREVMLFAWGQQGWSLQAMGFEEWTALAEMVSAASNVPADVSVQRIFPGAITAEASSGRLRLRRDK
jgi:tRNA(Ile)-lysidine synthase